MASRATRRSGPDLGSDDLALWRRAMRDVLPLRRGRPTPDDIAARADETPPPAPAPSEPAGTPARKPRPARTPAPVPAPPTGPRPLAAGRLDQMDRRTGERLRRGRMAIDGRLDLHGMTLDAAHAALRAFLRGGQAAGARCVLVITGKGRRRSRPDDPFGRDPFGGESGMEPGAIRRSLPHWLNAPDLRPLVVAVTEARPQDGGGGAFYVLLKRRRES